MYNEACVLDHRYTCVVVGLAFILYFIVFCVISYPDVGRLLNFPLRLRETKLSTRTESPLRRQLCMCLAKNLFVIVFLYKVKIFFAKYSISQFTTVPATLKNQYLASICILFFFKICSCK